MHASLARPPAWATHPLTLKPSRSALPVWWVCKACLCSPSVHHTHTSPVLRCAVQQRFWALRSCVRSVMLPLCFWLPLWLLWSGLAVPEHLPYSVSFLAALLWCCIYTYIYIYVHVCLVHGFCASSHVGTLSLYCPWHCPPAPSPENQFWWRGRENGKHQHVALLGACCLMTVS